jgi:large subunit ribosomal protein L25
MAQDLTLTAEPRAQLKHGLSAMRRLGRMPAIVYGHGVDAMPLVVEQAAFSRLWRSAGMSHMVQLAVKGEARPRRVLVREVQVSPRTGNLLHVDLYQVNPKEKIHTEVAVVLEGEPVPVTQREALLARGPDHLRVECLPDDLPEAFVVDVSGLKEVTDVIRVSDLPVPPGVTILNEPDTLIATLTTKAVRAEAEEQAAEAAAAEAASAEAAGVEVPEGEAQPAGGAAGQETSES